MHVRLKHRPMTAIPYQPDKGLEDGYAVYETNYPDEGHFFVDTQQVNSDRMTVIQAAIHTGSGWKVVSPGDWIISYEDGTGSRDVVPDHVFQRDYEPITEYLTNLEGRILRMETTVQRMNLELRVAREDLVLLEEGVTADIQSLQKRSDRDGT